MRKLKKVKNKGIVFWITGLSGSGKTRIGKKIKKEIIKNYGPTILFSGDDIRKIFELKNYSYAGRMKVVSQYCKICKNISNQNINIIFCVVGLMKKIRDWNSNNIKNYLEIFIKAPVKTLVRKSNKKVYRKKNINNVVGLDIKPEYPSNPHITIKNDYKKSIEKISKELVSKIKKIILY